MQAGQCGRRLAATIVVLAGGVLAAAGAGASEITRGRDIAQGYCSRCHAVGPEGASPQRLVIPFRDLASRAPLEMLDEASRTGVVAGHDEMPMFEIGTDGAKALRAYIESLWAPEAKGRNPGVGR